MGEAIAVGVLFVAIVAVVYALRSGNREVPKVEPRPDAGPVERPEKPVGKFPD